MRIFAICAYLCMRIFWYMRIFIYAHPNIYAHLWYMRIFIFMRILMYAHLLYMRMFCICASIYIYICASLCMYAHLWLKRFIFYLLPVHDSLPIWCYGKFDFLSTEIFNNVYTSLLLFKHRSRVIITIIITVIV